KTQCEQHRDRYPLLGAYVPQCDDQGLYIPLQCHGSSGHCWCVDSNGQERPGTRTPPGTRSDPGTPSVDCDKSGYIVVTLLLLSVISIKNHSLHNNCI
uniref:Thyroglobulin type-1 domain-containing protein n=1 Tax=Cynoglossus semilaevis TaxID=244447 RepID=A0A3P8W1V3_CYNSE